MDIRAFIALRGIEVPITSASITSFILATARNYLLSVILVFERGRFRRRIEMLRFLTVVLVGSRTQHVTGLVLCLSASNSPNCGEDCRRSYRADLATILGSAYSCSATRYRLRCAPS